MRWIWIDRFTHFESRKTATAVKNLSMAEDHFQEHFPGFPVMPAPLILEGLAQTGGILVGEANDFKLNVVLAKIPKATFFREACPGETLEYTTEILNLADEGAAVKGTVTSNGEAVAEAEIFFAHVDAARSIALFGASSFVFDGELKYLLMNAKRAQPV